LHLRLTKERQTVPQNMQVGSGVERVLFRQFLEDADYLTKETDVLGEGQGEVPELVVSYVKLSQKSFTMCFQQIIQMRENFNFLSSFLWN